MKGKRYFKRNDCVYLVSVVLALVPAVSFFDLAMRNGLQPYFAFVSSVGTYFGVLVLGMIKDRIIGFEL